MEPCVMQQEIATLQSQATTIFKRIDEQVTLTKSIYELVAEVKVMNIKLQNLSDTQGGMVKEIEELKGRSGRRYESAIQSAIGALVGGLIAYMLLRLGLR